MQTRAEVKKLLSEASVLYCFENSSIITEAILSGTPVILIRSTFFKTVIAEQETGWGGMRFSDEKDALLEAKSTIVNGIEMYKNAESVYWRDLEDFIKLSQDFFGQNPQSQELRLSKPHRIFYEHKLKLAIQILRSKGLKVLIRMILHYFKRKVGLQRVRND
jgi:hypothetical protein